MSVGPPVGDSVGEDVGKTVGEDDGMALEGRVGAAVGTVVQAHALHVELSKGAGHAATVPRPGAVTVRDRCATPEPQASVHVDQVLQNDLAHI